MAQALSTSGALITNPSNALPLDGVKIDAGLDQYDATEKKTSTPINAAQIAANNQSAVANASAYRQAQQAAVKNSALANISVVGPTGRPLNPATLAAATGTAGAGTVQVAQVNPPQYNYTWLLAFLILIILIIAFIVSYRNQSNVYRGVYRMQ